MDMIPPIKTQRSKKAQNPMSFLEGIAATVSKGTETGFNESTM